MMVHSFFIQDPDWCFRYTSTCSLFKQLSQRLVLQILFRTFFAKIANHAYDSSQHSHLPESPYWK
jgi:hypothetical protein